MDKDVLKPKNNKNIKEDYIMLKLNGYEIFEVVESVTAIEDMVASGLPLSMAIYKYIHAGNTYADLITRLTTVHLSQFFYETDNERLLVFFPWEYRVAEKAKEVDALYKKHRPVPFLVDTGYTFEEGADETRVFHIPVRRPRV